METRGGGGWGGLRAIIQQGVHLSRGEEKKLGSNNMYTQAGFSIEYMQGLIENTKSLHRTQVLCVGQ